MNLCDFCRKNFSEGNLESKHNKLKWDICRYCMEDCLTYLNRLNNPVNRPIDAHRWRDQ